MQDHHQSPLTVLDENKAERTVPNNIKTQAKMNAGSLDMLMKRSERGCESGCPSAGGIDQSAADGGVCAYCGSGRPGLE